MNTAFVLLSLFMCWTRCMCSAEEVGADTAEDAEQLVKEFSTTEELVDIICSCREETQTADDAIEPLNPHPYPRDCYDILQLGQTESGRYDIFPIDESGSPAADDAVRVYCDMDTDGGGWTVFQRRMDGSVDFYLDWEAYKCGFGFTGGEYWLGNDNINIITNQRNYGLRVDLEDWDGVKRFANYDHFRLGDESTNYKLLLGSYTGNAGDSLGYHRNQPFSTAEVDNDASSANCAERGKGPWWYKSCEHSDLNGMYNKAAGTIHEGVMWHHFKGYSYSLKFSDMKIRPTGIVEN